MKPRTAAAFLAATVLAGCAPRAESDAMRESRERVMLARELMDLADHAATVMDDVVSMDSVNRVDPLRLAAESKVRSNVIDVVRAIALTPSPREGMARMYVWSHLAVWSCENRHRLNPEAFVDNCQATFGTIRDNIARAAAKVFDERTRGHLDRLVAKYQASHEGLITIGLMRIDDIVDPGGLEHLVIEESDDSITGSVNDATRQLEQTRLLGERLVWLVSRMPATLSQAADGSVRLALEGQRVREAMTTLEQGSSRIATVSASLEQVAKSQSELAGRVDSLAKGVEGIGTEAAALHREIVVELVALGAILLVTLVIGFRTVARALRPADQGRGST